MADRDIWNCPGQTGTAFISLTSLFVIGGLRSFWLTPNRRASGSGKLASTPAPDWERGDSHAARFDLESQSQSGTLVPMFEWTFPFTTMVDACGNEKCGKSFEITITDRNSKEHACPHCGTTHTFDFEAAEKALLEAADRAGRNIGKKLG